MQALIEFIAGFVAMLVAAALSQFGVDMDSRPSPPREIHRIHDCGDAPADAMIAASSERRGRC
jgi:hypothetical protein